MLRFLKLSLITFVLVAFAKSAFCQSVPNYSDLRQRMSIIESSLLPTYERQNKVGKKASRDLEKALSVGGSNSDLRGKSLLLLELAMAAQLTLQKIAEVMIDIHRVNNMETSVLSLGWTQAQQPCVRLEQVGYQVV